MMGRLMQYSRDGNLHRIARITGPMHNFLAIEFGGTDANSCIVERLVRAAGTSGELHGEEVKKWVLNAVASANAEFGTHLVVRRIQYVADDTPDANAYAIIAHELVRRAR
ncbi:MAG: hypothetical protein JWM97_2525 [Phycisphaerales bacterium]|nr:hypothetical protein [Phycisphaerales bacterium]